MTKNNIDSYKFACAVARFLDENIANNISILNISNVSSFADYFVICSAGSNTQVKAITENIADKIKKTFEKVPIGRENDIRNRWNLIDYGDIVIHILHKEEREAYAIEKFWNHAFSIPESEWMKESEEYSDYKNIER